MIRFAPVLIPVFVLAACGGEADRAEGDTTEIAENGVGTRDVIAQPLRPGLWELSETIGEVDQATMRDRQETEIEADGEQRGATRTVCLPTEYTDRPPHGFWVGSDNACDYDSFEMANGELNAALTCNATPGSLGVTIDGTYGDNTFDVAMTSARTGTGEENITVNGRLEGQWLRECNAEEAS